MKSGKLALFAMLTLMALFAGCGGSGGGDGSSSTGTVTMSITDAKPVLPDNVTNCFVTIDQVLVHKSGGGWNDALSLPISPDPFVIDLMQFSDGITTELVPPVKIDSGKYTQIRLSVSSAVLRFSYPKTDSEDARTEDITITIPSENLKTDKNFDFEVTENSAVDITVDFDLSKSIIVEGPAAAPSYKLKPVLHVVETAEAATIEGTIDNGRFEGDYVKIKVEDSTGDDYTEVEVYRDNDPDATETQYSIYWLVPNQKYTVYVNYNPGSDDNDAEPGIQDNYDESAEVPAPGDENYPNGLLKPGDIYTPEFFPLNN